MGEHLEDGPVEPLRRDGGEPQPHDPHVGDAGKGNHVLEVALSQPHKDPIDDADGRQNGHHGRPVLPTYGAEKDRHPQDSEGPNLHEDTCMNHAHRGGSGHVAHGRPRMKRPDARENPEAEVKEDEGELLLSRRQGPRLHEGQDVESLQPRGHRQIHDAGENQGASRQKIKEKLEGPVLLARRSPDGNKRIHGEERDVVPDKEEEEIHAHEEAEDPEYEHEGKGEELLDPAPQLPHGQNAGEVHNPGEEDQGKVEAVRPIEIMDSQRFHPPQFLYELQATTSPVICAIDIDGESQGDSRESQADPLDQGLSLARDEQDDQKAHHATEKDGREVRKTCQFHIHLSTLCKQKVERDQSQGREHDGKVVPQFPGLQKGEEATAAQSEPAEPVDAVVDEPVLVLGACPGEDPVDDDVHNPPIQVVQIPALGKELPEWLNSLHETDLRGSAAAELEPG